VIQDRQQVAEWLFSEFAEHVAAVLELMAGGRPQTVVASLEGAPETIELGWGQSLPPLPGRLLVASTEAEGLAIGDLILRAAEVEEADAEELKSTYTETLGQALSSLAQSLAGRLGKEVTCANGGETDQALGPAIWSSVSLSLGDRSVALVVGIEATLLDAVVEQTPSETSSGEATPEGPEVDQAVAVAAGAGASQSVEAGASKTFDLLLDVEMPVSVSFGKAQVPLKDVLKLTTGSIVELNRAIAEPVDVVVNNCVIARGEVVVVEGNFGVRIQHVVSRYERLRSLR